MTVALFQRPPFKLVEMQLFNWGTFAGLHVIPVAPEGFLVVGMSGSGKSTLLDAFSTLMVPPALRHYNVAAREGERGGGNDRNVISYLRGAWSENEDPEVGRSVPQYLRPKATWSAISLRYTAEDGREVTLCGVFSIKTSAMRSSDVKYLYMIHERAFGIGELDGIAPETRRINRAFPDAFTTTSFNVYAERFCSRLGIPALAALRLLQKAQSAKNLGDLNLFLREFMLEEPGTFEAAEKLVDDFTSLKAAHEAVVDIRNKIVALKPIRENAEGRTEALAEKGRLLEQSNGIERYMADRERKLIKIERERLESNKKDFSEQHQAAVRLRHGREDILRALESQYNEQGGERLAILKNSMANFEAKRLTARDKMARIQKACADLALPVPTSTTDYSRLSRECRNAMQNMATVLDASRQEMRELTIGENDIKGKIAEYIRSIESMKRQSSNIHDQALELRRRIAQAIGCADSYLPFAGELMEVPEEYREWRGAIERLMRPLSLSILVDEKFYSAFTAYVNDHDLKRKLEYHRTNFMEKNRNHGKRNTVNDRIAIKEHVLGAWLRAKVGHSFNYVCAETLEEFYQEDFALTRTGLSRSGKSRHVKDDSRAIDDMHNWFMGFSNTEKRARFEQEKQGLEKALKPIAGRILELTNEDSKRGILLIARQRILDETWESIDEGAIITQIRELENTIETLSSGELKNLEKSCDNARSEYSKAKKEEESLGKKLAVAENEIMKIERREENVEQILNALQTLSLEVSACIDERAADTGMEITLDSLPVLERTLNRSLSQEITRCDSGINTFESNILVSMKDYLRNWTDEEGDLVPTLDGVTDFIERLAALEEEQLDRHEEHFFTLLRDHSNRLLAELVQELDAARRSIRDRLAEVNRGLKGKQYNPGTHLQIQKQDLHIHEAEQFTRDANDALTGSFEFMDRPMMESQFEKLAKIVDMLKSNDGVDAAWRRRALDVRLHVEFIGYELDDLSGASRETYRGGGGKSGGQRQKLTATCLAAALRYQLGGADMLPPSYTTVVLDEAFDKADHEFTRQAMSIFAEFGFQMIIATPMKAVRTLEPFVGGACVVVIEDRRYSKIHPISYDRTHHRLNLGGKQTQTDVSDSEDTMA